MAIFREQKGIEYRAEIKDGSPESSTYPLSSWILQDKAERFKLTMTYSFLAIEDIHYTSLDDYLAIIQSVIQAFSAEYQKPDYTRIGLRYINTINLKEGDPLDWSSYISDSLTCCVSNFLADKTQLSRAMGQYTINRESYSVIWNYGICNPEFPAKISRRQYILDYDCYSQDVSADIIEQLRTFNVAVLELFERV